MRAVLKDNIILIYINRNIMSLEGEVIVLSILPLRCQVQNWILRDMEEGVCSEEKEPREKLGDMTSRCSFCSDYRVLLQAG